MMRRETQMPETGNQKLVKKINKSIVLKMIRNHAPISRAAISQKSGLNRGTVSSLVSELIEEKLISESGMGKSRGGRKPVILLFNQFAGYSIGIDLGVNYLLGVLTDLKGKIVEERKITIHNLSQKDIIAHIKDMIYQLREAAPSSPNGIVGIGIGVPGIVDHDGDILLAPNLMWDHVPLKKILEEEFSIPILIENEANAGAYGEKLYGCGQEHENLIYISAGIGIGAGLILNDELYRGLKGYSGEVGHMVIDVEGRQCRCGRQGCWELYASEQAILREAESLGLKDTNGSLSLEALIQMAEEGNQYVIDLFKKAGKYLAVGILNMINTFNPEQVIIGNRLTMAEKWLKPVIQDTMLSQSKEFNQEGINLSFSQLATHSSPLGMAAFITEQFLESGIAQMY
ncbi:ROK family transcriptional regulator [Halobacillus salinarum]|uniref:ROK family transcriptional regulator n=1 Tax=Halobacillus salinarum TaxID=2932257 RepID=A0ABY4EIQ8_9BACI|nr:ROK family transcriptional regulator [Halobacillus salinarum]UOQ44029.1 ROK family transcriptional regulator [Halobacillus salinarum]